MRRTHKLPEAVILTGDELIEVQQEGIYKKTTKSQLSGSGGYDGNPNIIVQDSTHRFATDSEKTTWNGKADALGSDDNYVTDAEKTKISNLSGTNTGDQDLSGKADAVHTHPQSDITGLSLSLAAKANVVHTHPQGDIEGLGSALLGKAAASHNHSGIYADLVGGVIPTSQIPAIAISEFLGEVISQPAMLALIGQRGDWCIRTDLSRTFILIAEPSGIIDNWKQLQTPSGAVTSVNGQSGVVVLSKSDVGLSNVDNTSDANKPISTAQQTALDGKSSTSHNHDGAYSIIGHNHTGTYEPANANIQSHVISGHAPANAQKNSDITLAEIEAKLVGVISSHSHAGGSVDIKQTEIDFGSVPVKMQKFTITDAGVLPSNQIMVNVSYDNPSDGDEDSAEWFENLVVMARAGTGQFFLYCNSIYNDLNGKVKINYLIG